MGRRESYNNKGNIKGLGPQLEGKDRKQNSCDFFYIKIHYSGIIWKWNWFNMLYLKRDHFTEWFNGKQNKRKYSSASPFTVLKTNCIDDRVYASALDSGLAPLLWASPHCATIVCLCACFLHCAMSTSAVGPKLAVLLLLWCTQTGLPILVLEYTNWLINCGADCK